MGETDAALKVFRGHRDEQNICHVVVEQDGEQWPLAPRLDLRNASPTGFEWGYGGSGPAQLALAILVEALGDDRQALELHQTYKWDVIAKLNRETPWTINGREVEAWRDLNYCNGEGD